MRNLAKNPFARGIMAGAIIMALGVGASAYMLAGSAQAQQEDAIRVGTFNMETVFQQSDLGSQLQQEAMSMQQEMQQAQQEQDQQKMQELQQQFQQQQNQMVDNFRSTLDEIVPSVAEEENLSLVVAEVMYKQDNVEEVTITEQLAEQMNEAAGSEQGTITVPQPDQGQGQ